MLRFILILIFLFFLWRIIKIVGRIMSRNNELSKNRKSSYPFKDIEEADFEDISENPTEKNKNLPKN